MSLSQTLCDVNQRAVNIGGSRNDNASAEYASGFSGWSFGSAKNHSEDKNAVECEMNGCERVTVISLTANETDSKVVPDVQAIDIRSDKTTVKTIMRHPNKSVEHFLVKCRGDGRCTALFESQEAMVHHVSNYHARGVNKTFCCYLCQKAFTRKSYLKNHFLALHTAPKWLKCSFPMCSQRFSFKRSLKRHINCIHATKITFKCMKCPMIFYRAFHLKLHSRSEHGEGAIHCCSLCNKTVLTHKSLQRHIKTVHTGQIRFQCSVELCSKFFSSKHSLNKHTAAFHTEKTVLTGVHRNSNVEQL